MAVTFYTVGGTVYVTLVAQKLVDAFAASPTYANYDLTTPLLLVQQPDGTVVTYSPTDPNWHKPASTTGEYYVVLVPLQVGPYNWKWVDGDPTEPGILTGAFTMRAPKF